LKLLVQAPSELHDNSSAFRVACISDQFFKLIDVIIHRAPSLEVSNAFQFGQGSHLFISWAEPQLEGMLKGGPGIEQRSPGLL
jgi:hypothetical protein